MKVVLITGATGGIGRAIALKFAREGYPVAMQYARNEVAAQALLQEIRALPAYGQMFQADLTKPGEAEFLYREVKRQMGAPGILINNAGIARRALFTDETHASVQKLFQVDLEAAMFLCREALEDMYRAAGGSIVNISSIWGSRGASCEVVYSTAKAALEGFTRALSREAGPMGVRVNAVAPGVIDTAMNASFSEQEREELAQSCALCRWGQPEEVAEAVYFLASNQASYITGQILTVDGGFIG